MVIRAIIMGTIQGLTEFAPVSSSGHLVAVPRLMGWPDPGLSFDVALHAGTLLAVLVYFRSDWLEVLKGFFSSFRARPSRWNHGQRLAWSLVLATVPAGLAGAALSGFFENPMRSLGSVGGCLLFTGAIMLVAEKLGSMKRGMEELNILDAASVGLMQVLALAPGISRSGITISAGIFRGLKRESAARFSFLLSAPVIAGAGLKECLELLRGSGPSPGALSTLAGAGAAAVSGFFVIRFLLAYLKRKSLLPFALYCLAAGSALWLLVILGGYS